jgi:ribosomal protein L7/L12
MTKAELIQKIITQTEGLNKKDAEEMKKKLEAAGAKVELK